MPRLITISNRLPVSLQFENGEFSSVSSPGGLATGLNSYKKHNQTLWVGWPGMQVAEELQPEVEKELAADHMACVFLSNQEMAGFYEGFSNTTLWPLFHYFKQYTEYNTDFWLAYKHANQRFADKIFEIANEDDIFWIHDYQLMLLPELIRTRFPNATIGFFLHIPFPSYEFFRTLPWRSELLKGVLGADLIGFHTYDYVRHFLNSATLILGLEHTLGRLAVQDRTVETDVFAMGIDYEKFSNSIYEPKTIREVINLRGQLGSRKIILSIDRLDYSKGILQRLEAFDMFLSGFPAYKNQVSLVMVVVPSRDNVWQYGQLKEEIDKAVGRINGKYSTPDWVAVHYFYRALSFETLTGLYYTSDIALVTPFRDGMNLIAKEYVATKTDRLGVLILSEMAGAAHELTQAILINPDDIKGISLAIHQALEMPENQRIKRMEAMQETVRHYNVVCWADLFLQRLNTAHHHQQTRALQYWNPIHQKNLLSAYQKTSKRLLLLDYDGTLMDFKSDPKLARPDKPLYQIIEKLSADVANQIVIISGRDKKFLQKYFGHLNIGLVAEHGVWQQFPGQEWKHIPNISSEWKPKVRELLDFFVDRTPGSFVEEKNYSLVWHYRNLNVQLGYIRSRELVDMLHGQLSGTNLQVLEGNKVIEIKIAGISKASAAQVWLDWQNYDFILALGDDRTDEDTFKQLPPHAYSIKVGYGYTQARFHIQSVSGVRNLLSSLGV